MTGSGFAPPYPLNTAVLFLVFNRPDTTKQVFEAIRMAKPPRLYVAADGSRLNLDGEKERVQAVRSYAIESIDWECKVKTLFRDNNLGCKYAVSEAITWFFEQEEMGIILEDDCLPSLSFFWYCEELLDKYKDNDRIMQINGSCFLNNIHINDSYFFSKYNHVWGWAGWHRAWQHFKLELDDFDKSFGAIKSLFHNKNEKDYWYKVLSKYYTGHIDTWDYPWTFSIWQKNGLCVYPVINMVKNIGFGREDATHTSGCVPHINQMQQNNISFLLHPDVVELNKYYDLENYNLMFKPSSFLKRVIRKMHLIYHNEILRNYK